MSAKRNVLLWAAVVALALPLLFAANAFALYAGDGTKQNGTTGGWDITDYGVCVSGIQSDGTIVVDSSKTSRAACITVTFPSLTTSAACVGDSDANGGSHYWQNNCVDGSGNAISLDGLDRTSANCALKGGTWTSRCTGEWVYTGPNNDGIGFEGGGFCYTTIIVGSGTLTIDGGYAEGTCPTLTTGYTTTGTGATYKCTYSYGIAGIANAAISYKRGGTYAAANSYVDLSSLNQGLCLANGASWGTGVRKSGVTSFGTTTVSTVATIEDTRAGCLECHNSTSQRNQYAERWKEKYVMTGHKNMLRKVTAGMNWAGPDGAIYDAYAAGTLDFTTATAQVSGVDKPLLYIFGDWMAPAPSGLDVVVNMSGSAKYNGTSNYSCAPCHATGWSNPSAGLCSLSSYTTSANCSGAGGTWYPMNGVQGATYVPAEPANSFPGITFTGAGKWDRDGILCSRCHQAVFSKTSPAPAGTSGHNVTPATNANQQVNNICFGCHQSIAKTGNNTGANADLGNPAANIPAKNSGPTATYAPMFSGHVLGSEFLNSPHARYSAPASGDSIVPNSLGKYDLVGNAASQYGSAFKGYVCRSSTYVAGGSILAKVAKTAGPAEIKNLADCNLANGKGSEAVPDLSSYASGTQPGYWQTENQGACTTCHDVHQSMFVTGQEGLKKECETCHEDTAGAGGPGYAALGVPQVDMATVNHPKVGGSPFDVTRFKNACEVCHMPKPTDGDFPLHFWRINTDVNYRTLPTIGQIQGGLCSNGTSTTSSNCTSAGGTWTAQTKNASAQTADDGGYTNAIWVDVDLACGQCHGGSNAATANGAPYFNKASLASAAVGMHKIAWGSATYATPLFTWTASATTSLLVDFNAGASVCPSGSTCTYAWDFGDTTTGSGVTASHTYASASSVLVKLTITATDGNGFATTASLGKTVTPNAINHAPVASATSTFPTGTVGNPTLVTNTSNNLFFTDTSTDPDGAADIKKVVVNWGDGTVETKAAGSDFSHNYTRAMRFAVTMSVYDNGGKTSFIRGYVKVVPPKYVISGKVTASDGTTPIAGAYVSLKLNGHTRSSKITAADGSYSFPAQLPGTYTIKAYKKSFTFSVPAATVTLTNADVVQNITAAP